MQQIVMVRQNQKLQIVQIGDEVTFRLLRRPRHSIISSEEGSLLAEAAGTGAHKVSLAISPNHVIACLFFI